MRRAVTRLHRSGWCCGFTVVELLVAVAICAILMALLLPAVQSVRVTSQRMSCQARLRQIGLGLHSYHELHSSFPPGSYLMGPSFPMQSGWGWGAMILPSLDEGPLYQTIDFGRGTAVGSNQSLIATPVAIFRCPSDLAEPRIQCTTWDGKPFDLASGNYCGSEWILGAMSSVRIAEVHDGASQTLLAGERRVQSGEEGRSLPFTSAWCGHVAFESDYEYRSVPYLQTHRARRINNSRRDPNCFGSHHQGGANFLMVDGSVHFLSNHLDGGLLEALGTPAGGETAPPP